ncbi:hypothetical protein JCM33374_g1170 [Metschnikowia sp. JCM 33374]|nr:hypothetical protein JCM33374_g1170 [Metschnikowia sp. JCM 33374]
MLSALMRKKPSKKVTLKVPGSVLEEISKSMNPLYTKSSGPREGKSSSSAFSMMMKSASQNAFPKLTAIQKLKGLLPPPIPRNAMHVLPEGDIFSEGMIRLPARRHTRPTVDIHEGSMSDFIPDPLPASSVSPCQGYDTVDLVTTPKTSY